MGFSGAAKAITIANKSTREREKRHGSGIVGGAQRR